jgi:hypothetical protein
MQSQSSFTRIAAVASWAVTAACVSAAAGQNLIENGDFEHPVVATNAGWDVFTETDADWTTEWNEGTGTFNGNSRPLDALLEFHTSGVISGVAAASGNQYVELDSDWTGPVNGFTGEPANVRISQQIDTIDGAIYTLSYAWRSRPSPSNALASSKMKVSWGGQELATHQDTTNNGWHTEEWTVEGDGGAIELAFTEIGQNDSLGTFLDSVSLTLDAVVYDLCAGNDGMPVGTVTVRQEDCQLYVDFETDGWVMSETHLDFGFSLDDIPQTRKGNPIPGQFDYQQSYEDYTTFASYGPFDLVEDGTLYLAAHAVVLDATNLGEGAMSVFSQGGVDTNGDGFVDDGPIDVYGPLVSYEEPGDAAWGDPMLAVATWNHGNWASVTSQFTAPGFYNPGQPEWISNTYYIGTDGTPVATPTFRWFHTEFELPYTAFNIAAEVVATGDNAEQVWVNGQFIGQNGTWPTITLYDMLPVTPGMNQLDFIVENYNGSADWFANPTGLIFDGLITYNYYLYEETAWGDGCDGAGFEGRNWATYFTFEVVGCEPVE